MLKRLSILLLTTPTVALAQQGPPFVPFTIDAQRYQQIDDLMSKQSMPRDAHAAWANIWQQLERQAQTEKDRERLKEEKPK